MIGPLTDASGVVFTAENPPVEDVGRQAEDAQVAADLTVLRRVHHHEREPALVGLLERLDGSPLRHETVVGVTTF